MLPPPKKKSKISKLIVIQYEDYRAAVCADHERWVRWQLHTYNTIEHGGCVFFLWKPKESVNYTGHRTAVTGELSLSPQNKQMHVSGEMKSEV